MARWKSASVAAFSIAAVLAAVAGVVAGSYMFYLAAAIFLVAALLQMRAGNNL